MNEIERIKQLAGVNEFNGYTVYSPKSLVDQSAVAAKLKQVEEENSFGPGTPEWFDLWFKSCNNLDNVPSFRGRKK